LLASKRGATFVTAAGAGKGTAGGEKVKWRDRERGGRENEE
jgi:hypothetical protein